MYAGSRSVPGKNYGIVFCMNIRVFSNVPSFKMFSVILLTLTGAVLTRSEATSDFRYVAGVFSGASQNAVWFSGSGDPVDSGFSDPGSKVSGMGVWKQELTECLPGATVDVSHVVKAGVGFVSHWWTESEGLTENGKKVRDELIAKMRKYPEAYGFVCHVLASAAYNEASAERLKTELSGYAKALCSAVDSEFGVGARTFRFWWLSPGNRWGEPQWGQASASERSGAVLSLANELPFFRIAPGVMTYAIGDWNKSGDGIHYTRAGNQRAGRQLAFSMMLDMGVRPRGISRELKVLSAARDQSDPNAVIVKVATNGGVLHADVRSCRIAVSGGDGVGTGKEGILLSSEWKCEVDNSTSGSGFSTVRLRHVNPLPDKPLEFSHTWGTWHVVTPGRPGYTGALSVWHEDVAGGAGMTQDFRDILQAGRRAVMTLGESLSIPVK